MAPRVICDERRYLQFLESLTAAAIAYGDLDVATRYQLEIMLPRVGAYLKAISEGLAERACVALGEELLLKSAPGA
jgi:hypothetical protein